MLNSILVEKDTGRRYWFDAESTSVTNQDIEWTNGTNVTVSGNTITATAGSWSCIARSIQTISPSRGGGTIIGQHSLNYGMIGFSKDPYYTSGNTFANGNHLMYHDGIYELGTEVDTFTAGSNTTNYKVTMDSNGLVKYFVDNGSGYSEVYESTVTASGEYYVLGTPDGSGSTVSGTITGILTPATWVAGCNNSVTSTGTLGTNGDMTTTLGGITKTSDGNPCNAWDFDGVNGVQYGITGTDFPLASTDVFTASFWIRPDVVTGGAMFGKGAGGSGHAVQMNITSGGALQMVSTEAGVGNTFIATTNTMTATNLYHCVCIHNGASSRVYLNAVIGSKGSGSLSGGANTTAEYWTIGNRMDNGVSTAGGTYFNGKILQCTFWGSVLTEANVTTLYNSGVPIPPNVDVNNIKAYYNFEQKTGTLVNKAI